MPRPLCSRPDCHDGWLGYDPDLRPIPCPSCRDIIPATALASQRPRPSDAPVAAAYAVHAADTRPCPRCHATAGHACHNPRTHRAAKAPCVTRTRPPRTQHSYAA
ncbi:hypothetical protein ACWDUL_33740 [Nocardia niigatensis]